MSVKSINIHQGLIDACKQNDSKAQFKIYKLYYKAMYNTSLRILNNPATAEDVMQEAFLDAFRKIDTYAGIASFGSWLKKIVINKSINEVRKYKETISLNEKEIDFPEVTEDHLEDLSYKVETIKKAIFDLPEDYRTIISLYLLEGYDHEEISEILNISYNATRTRYSRAKKKLLQIITKNQLNIISQN